MQSLVSIANLLSRLFSLFSWVQHPGTTRPFVRSFVGPSVRQRATLAAATFLFFRVLRKFLGQQLRQALKKSTPICFVSCSTFVFVSYKKYGIYSNTVKSLSKLGCISNSILS